MVKMLVFSTYTLVDLVKRNLLLLVMCRDLPTVNVSRHRVLLVLLNNVIVQCLVTYVVLHMSRARVVVSCFLECRLCCIVNVSTFISY